MSRDNLNPHDAAALLRKTGRTSKEIAELLGVDAIEPAGKPGLRSAFDRRAGYGAKAYYSAKFNRTFKSTGEGRYAERVLWPLVKAGAISNLAFEQSVTLIQVTVMLDGRSKKIRKSCRPDYRYVEDGVTIYHEYKGHADDRWIFQLILWTLGGPGPYRITWAKSGNTDTLYPRGMTVASAEKDGKSNELD